MMQRSTCLAAFSFVVSSPMFFIRPFSCLVFLDHCVIAWFQRTVRRQFSCLQDDGSERRGRPEDVASSGTTPVLAEGGIPVSVSLQSRHQSQGQAQGQSHRDSYKLAVSVSPRGG